MIISNIGTIVLSLYHESMSGIKSLSTSAETVTTTQVRLLSISNTLSRLISGPLADFIFPLTSRIPGDRPPLRKYRISRVVLLSGTSLLLAGAFVYLELAIRTPDDLWILRYAALAFCVYILFSDLIQCCYRCCIWYHLHNSVCHSFYLLFSYIAYSSRPGTDPVLYPASGGKRTLGAISV
jgi:hypothetical protein